MYGNRRRKSIRSTHTITTITATQKSSKKKTAINTTVIESPIIPQSAPKDHGVLK